MAHMLTVLGSRFSPLELSGLAIWLDGQNKASISLSGSQVTQWNNQGNVTGVGHATQGIALRQPKYVASAINGWPGIQGLHDGTNASQLEVADSTGLDYTRFTSFVVAKRASDLNATESIHGKYTITGDQREHRLFISGSTDNPALQYSQTGTSPTSAVAELSSAIATNSPFVMISSYNGSAITLMRGNGATTSATYSSGIFNGTSPYYLFSMSGSQVEPYAGYIGEFLFYNRALSALENREVMSYLKGKWGIW